MRPVRSDGHVKDHVQLLETQSTCFRHEKEDQDSPDQTPGRVEAKGSRGGHGRQHRRPRHGQRETEEPGRRRGETHPQCPHVQWKGFASVHERDDALAWSVCGLP